MTKGETERLRIFIKKHRERGIHSFHGTLKTYAGKFLYIDGIADHALKIKERWNTKGIETWPIIFERFRWVKDIYLWITDWKGNTSYF